MLRAAKWEIVGIAVAIGALGAIRTKLPVKIEVGEAVLLAAALLLAQGLIRDLFRVALARRPTGEETAAPRITCMCAESTLGVGGILVGVLLVFAVSPHVVATKPWAWPPAFACVTIFGFATRHLVIDWRARRLRWEPNHDGVRRVARLNGRAFGPRPSEHVTQRGGVELGCGRVIAK